MLGAQKYSWTTYFFKQRWQNLPGPQTFGESIEHASQPLHKRYLFFPGLGREVRPIEEVQGRNWEGREERMGRKRFRSWSGAIVPCNQWPKKYCGNVVMIFARRRRQSGSPCKSLSSRSKPGTGLEALSRSPLRLPWFLKGGLPLQWTAYTRQPREYISEAVTSCSSKAYSGAC